MSVILATTGSNALRHASTGLGVVRYWSYTKHPLGETWEADFPATIYLVGCHPPYAVMIWCTASPTQRVLYHSNESCSTTDPGGQYVISWDRRAYCPWGVSDVCPGGGGIEKATVPLCVTSSGSFLGLAYYSDVGGYFYNCVEAPWHIHRYVPGGLVCKQHGLLYNLSYGYPLIYGGDGEMAGDSTNGWSKGHWPYINYGGIVSISPAGAVSYSFTYEVSGLTVWYGGTGNDIALDTVWGCPIGTSVIPVYCSSWCLNYWDWMNQHYVYYNCSGCLANCGGHPVISLAGSITITTRMKVGSC